MSYDWKDYYELSKKIGDDAEIAEEVLSEALFRSAISRAYYALYNVSLEYAETLGYIYTNTYGCHEELIRFFSGRPDEDSRTIAMKLGTSRDFRVAADYHKKFRDDYPDLKRMKDGTITRTEDVFHIIEA